MNFGIVLILAAAAAASAPSPAPNPAPDPCGGRHTGILQTIDRPTIGFSPCAVKPKEALFELGYSNQNGTDGRAVTYPQGFLRYGTGPNLEVDFIGPAYEAQKAGGGTRQGLLDSGVGAKFELYHDTVSAAGVDFLYTVPSGAAVFSAGSPIETFNIDYSRSLSPAVGIAATLGSQSSFAQGSDGRSARFFSALPSALLSDQFNPRLQAYVEAYAQTRIRPDGGALFGTDAGLQYLPLPQLQLDLEAGRTAIGAARAHYYGFGLGWLL